MIVTFRVKKFKVVEQNISGKELFENEHPDAIINGGIYDGETGINMTFLTSDGKNSGSYFSRLGIGFDGQRMGFFKQGQVKNVMGGSPVIVELGVKAIHWGNKYSGYLDGEHIRSWMGLTRQKFLKFGVTEKRVSLKELQDIAINENCLDAIALDGGYSCFFQIGSDTIKSSTRKNASWILVWGDIMKTNEDLIIHCITALLEKWAYIFGFWGLVATERRIEEKRLRYPKEINRYYEYIMKYAKGRRAADCGGLIKSFLWWRGNDPVYDPSSDLSVDMMFEASAEKGLIRDIPEIPGLIVRYPGHAGVYIGNGEVIEARGTLYGVVKTNLKDRNWTHYFKHPDIEYLPVEEDSQEIFKDVSPDRWSYADIMSAVEAGILGGFPDGTFRPSEYVTREQLAVVSNRLLKIMEKGE